MSLNYTDTGHGKTVVLIHGFCESLTLWDHLEQELSKLCRVINVDLPGFGESKFLGNEITIEWFANEVLSLINELNIDSFSLIGHSLGGYVSLAMAEQHSKKIESMVLFHTTAYEDSEEKKVNRDKMCGFIERNGVDKFMTSFVSPLFSEKNRERCALEISKLTQDGKRADEEAVIATIKAMKKRPDRTSIIKEFPKPILWIVGEDDVAVPLKDSLEQIELGNMTQSIVLKNCGHMGMIEKPTTTTMRIVEFFI